MEYQLYYDLDTGEIKADAFCTHLEENVPAREAEKKETD